MTVHPVPIYTYVTLIHKFRLSVKNKTKNGKWNLQKIISGAYDTDYVCGVQYGGYVCDGDSGGPMVCEDTNGKTNYNMGHMCNISKKMADFL